MDITTPSAAPTASPNATPTATPSATPVVNDTATPSVTPEQKTWDLKADGKARKVTSEEDLIKLAQKGLTADERLEQIAKGRKELENFHNQLKKDPKGTIKSLAKQIGADPRQLAEDILGEFVQSDIEEFSKPKKTAEQLRIEELEAEVAKTQQEKEAAATTEKEKQFLAEKHEAQNYFVEDIGKALDMVGFIKDGPLGDEAVADAAHFMLLAYDAGFEEVHPEDVAAYIKDQHLSRVNALLSIEDDAKLFEMLPEAFVKRVGKHYYNKLKGGAQSATPQVDTSTPKQPERPKKLSELKRLGLA